MSVVANKLKKCLNCLTLRPTEAGGVLASEEKGAESQVFLMSSLELELYYGMVRSPEE